MRIIAIGLSALILLSASPKQLAAEETLTATVAARFHAPPPDALCNYCADYTNAAMPSGQIGFSAPILVSASSKALAAEDAPAATVAAQLHSAQPDALCNYCGDYSDASGGSGQITTVRLVGAGYPGERRN